MIEIDCMRKKTHEEYIIQVAEINPNIEVIEEYVGSGTKILHRCKIDGHEWNAQPNNILNGQGCPKCYGRILRTHEQYVKEVNLVNPNITVLDKYINSKTKIRHKCNIDGYIWRAKPENILLLNEGCPVCSGRVIGNAPEYKNSIWSSEYKEYFSRYLTEEQMKEYMSQSNLYVDATCPNCGRNKKTKVSNLFHRGFSCKCGDGQSYPNKFIYSLLEQLSVEYISEKSFDWSDRKVYDIYIPNLNCIIENHGIQHYSDVFDNTRRRTLEEEQQNDNYKKQLAINNDILHYIIIDCSLSQIDYIKNNIMNSELPHILNFKESDINWEKCHEFAISNLVKIAANLWNENLSVRQTANELHLHESTIERYLKMAAKLNWCNWYSGVGHKIAGQKRSGHKHPLARKIIRLSDCKLYDTITQAVIDNNISRSTIDRHLKKQKDFMYYDEYILLK